MFVFQYLQSLSRVMIECWAPNPAARLSSLRVKKTLGKMCDIFNKTTKSENKD